MPKLKRGDSVIDVPENKVAFYLHVGYVKVEEKTIEPVKEPEYKPLNKAIEKADWKKK